MSGESKGPPKLPRRRRVAILQEIHGLVRSKVLREYGGRCEAVQQDLYQAAMLACWQALFRYDPKKAKPSTFLYPHIRFAFQKFMSKDYPTIGRPPTTTSKVGPVSTVNCLKEVRGMRGREKDPQQVAMERELLRLYRNEN